MCWLRDKSEEGCDWFIYWRRGDFFWGGVVLLMGREARPERPWCLVVTGRQAARALWGESGVRARPLCVALAQVRWQRFQLNCRGMETPEQRHGRPRPPQPGMDSLDAGEHNAAWPDTSQSSGANCRAVSSFLSSFWGSARRGVCFRKSQ